MSAVSSRELYRTATLAWVDYMDAGFYRASGLLAPGKSYPLECGEPDNDRRRDECRAWNSLLGPPDMACILSLGILRDEREAFE